jgi:cystathionine beta-lyase
VALFTEPGQGVIIQTPIYHPFLDVVEELGRKLVDNPLHRTERRFEMDLDGLSQNIRPDTRLLMFCNPHNPSGRVFERDELQALADIAIEHDLLVISDEVHADLTYPGQQHIPLASISDEIAARTITLTSATKAFNIAGMKYALAHFPTPALMQHHMDHYHPRLLGVPSVFGIEATRAAWRDCNEWLEAVMTQLDENRRFIAEFLDERLPQISYRMPEAGYLFWLDCSELKLPQRAYEFFLEQAGVACSDGDEFSAYTQQCVRLNFATTPAILSDIMSRIADAVDSVS